MDRMTSVVIRGRTVWFNFSVSVMFDMTEKYGTAAAALDLLNNDGREGYEAVKWFALKMAEDAELCRREMGYEPEKMLTENDLDLRKFHPLEYSELIAAIVTAVQLGYNRELPQDEAEDKVRDLGLEELQAKKTTAGE